MVAHAPTRHPAVSVTADAGPPRRGCWPISFPWPTACRPSRGLVPQWTPPRSMQRCLGQRIQAVTARTGVSQALRLAFLPAVSPQTSGIQLNTHRFLPTGRPITQSHPKHVRKCSAT